jgi:hypothetical protein
MPVTLDATPGGAAANSYLTEAEAQTYFDTRTPGDIKDAWDNYDDQEQALMMATRVIDRLLTPMKTLIIQNGEKYYRIRPQWTGTPATTTQRLAWPRNGMFDQNGNAIDPSIIPQDLKDAVAELAGQLGVEDRTLDNSVITQGIKSIKAGSVSLTFADGLTPQVIPDFVYNLLPISWITDELYESAVPVIFDVIGDVSCW